MAGTGQPQLGNEALVQMRLAHLNIVQGVVNRLAGYSASVKTFCVTITAAVIALAVQTGSPGLVPVALGSIALFAVLDAYYLALERAFRHLYEEIVPRPLATAADLGIEREPVQLTELVSALRSVSVWTFYVALAVAILVLIGADHVRADTAA